MPKTVNIKLLEASYTKWNLQIKHGQNTIAMKNEGYKMIGHVPEALASKLFTLTKGTM